MLKAPCLPLPRAPKLLSPPLLESQPVGKVASVFSCLHQNKTGEFIMFKLHRRLYSIDKHACSITTEGIILGVV